jgi:hypothetical protein
VLSGTDACLEALTRRLNASAAAKAGGGGKAAKPISDQNGGSIASGAGGSGGCGEGAAGAWGLLAERLVGDVKEQPAMLEGGELRPYQMQVRGFMCL